MNSGSSDTIPNPFAVPLDRGRGGVKQTLMSAVKVILFAALALSAVSVIHRYHQTWILKGYTAGFADLTPEQKLSRLIDIASLDVVAVPHLVATLSDADPTVARASLELLQDAQKGWSLQSPDDATDRHQILLRAIFDQAAALSGDRTTWANGLVQSSLSHLKRIGSASDPEVGRYALAVLERLSLSGRDTDEPLSERAGVGEVSDRRADTRRDTDSPPRIAARIRPLPLTDVWEDDSVDRADAAAANRDDAPTIALKAVEPMDVRLNTVQVPGETSSEKTSEETMPAAAARPEAAGIQPTAHLVRSPLETLDNKSVVQFLASPRGDLRDMARSELKRRTWNDAQIELAGRLVTGSIPGRLELIDGLASATDQDPRAWLLFLLDDQDRRIRHRVVSILATINDTTIDTYLRQHEAKENDPEIRALLSSRRPVNVSRR